MTLDIGRIVQDALRTTDNTVKRLLRPVTYINVAGNPEYDPDTGQIRNGVPYEVKAVVTGYSAFEIASQVAQVRDAKLTFAARDFPPGFVPTTNDRVVLNGQDCPVADWQEAPVEGSVLIVRVHRP